MQSKRKRIKNLIKYVSLGATACSVVYAAVVISALKSFVNVKKDQYNKYDDVIFY